jgi:hypothetical protein
MTTHTHDDVSRGAGTTYSPHLPVDALLTRGVAAGLTGGLAFILINMFAAQSAGKPPVAPFLDISTIFRFSEMPNTDPMAVPVEVTLGIFVHLFLSALFGIVFALIAPLLRNPLLLVVGSLVYGLALYLVNFQVIGRLFFPWFVDPRGPSQVLELIVHPLVYGLALVPFFLSVAGHRPVRAS